MVPVLVCRACGGLTSSARFSYLCERLICDHCGAENPQTNVRSVQTRDIFVRFITTEGCSAQAVDLNLDRPLGPRVPVTSPEVLRRLLASLGAGREALRVYDRSKRYGRVPCVSPQGKREAQGAKEAILETTPARSVATSGEKGGLGHRVSGQVHAVASGYLI
jgi:hypothetical protein